MTGRWFLFLAMVISLPAVAQDWEFIGGPGGEPIRGLTITPKGDIFVLSNGVFRSTDKGATWRRSGFELPSFNTEKLPALEVAKNGVLYLATEGSLWKSVDEGLTWSNIKTLDTRRRYIDVEITPQGTIAVINGDSVAISNDGGSSWHNVFPTEQVHNLFVDSVGTIFAGGRFDSYRSTDQGENWSKMINGFPVYEVYDMQFAPDNVALVTSNDGIFVSTDGGISWSKKSGERSILKMAICPDGVVFGMNFTQGVERSDNFAIDWGGVLDNKKPTYDEENIVFFGGSVYYFWRYDIFSLTVAENVAKSIVIPNAVFLDFIISPSAKIYGLAKNSALWSFADDAWKKIETLPSVTAIAVDSLGKLYGISSTKFFTSLDDGLTATSSNGVSTAVTGLAVGKAGEVLAVTPADGFFRSTDGGKIWMQSNAGIPDKKLTSVAIGSGNVFFAGGNTRYYRSTDEGLSWHEPIFPFITGSGTVRTITTLGERVVFGIDLTGVYFSSDNGLFWENHSAGLALDTIHDITITSKGDIVCAASSGIYLYSPFLDTWKEIGPNIARKNMRTIAEAKDGRLYIGTDGNGVYRTKNPFSDVASQQSASSDIALFPNPASTEITIHFASGKQQQCRVAICNVLGQVLLTQSAEAVDALRIDVSSLHPAQYFLRVFDGNTMQTMPLSIVK